MLGKRSAIGEVGAGNSLESEPETSATKGSPNTDRLASFGYLADMIARAYADLQAWLNQATQVQQIEKENANKK